MRTRCKFRVVGVEEVEHAIFNRVYQDSVSEEEYAATGGTEYADTYSGGSGGPLSGGRKYKSVFKANAQNVRLAAQYDSSNPEDVSFAEATPSGELKIYVSNPVVIGNFKIGKSYYLDLIPCE